MESPQLHAVGFDFPSLDDLVKAAFAAGVRGIETAPGFDLIGTYSDSSGARLVFIKREGESASTTAALSSTVTHRAQVVRFTDQLARVAIYNADDGELDAQFLALVDDPVAYPLSDLSDGKLLAVADNLQLAALALDVQVFPNAAAFEESPAAQPTATVRVPADALISPSLMALQSGAIQPTEATPTLLMGIVVDTVETRRNELSGVEFQYVVGESAVRIAASVPMEQPVEPGNVVYGAFYASVTSGTWDQPSEDAGGADQL